MIHPAARAALAIIPALPYFTMAAKTPSKVNEFINKYYGAAVFPAIECQINALIGRRTTSINLGLNFVLGAAMTCHLDRKTLFSTMQIVNIGLGIISLYRGDYTYGVPAILASGTVAALNRKK